VGKKRNGVNQISESGRPLRFIETRPGRGRKKVEPIAGEMKARDSGYGKIRFA